MYNVHLQEVHWAFKIGRYKNDINENRTNGLMLTLCYLANKGKEECESFHIWIICSQVFRTKTNAFSFIHYPRRMETWYFPFNTQHLSLLYFIYKIIPKTEKKYYLKIINNFKTSLWVFGHLWPSLRCIFSWLFSLDAYCLI